MNTLKCFELIGKKEGADTVGESRQNHLIDRLDTSTSNKIQVLRGLAIIAVVMIHNTPGGISQVVIRPFLNFCVGLFLFLSGMLSDAEKWNPAKRISKVLIPYAIWTLIYVVLSEYTTPLRIPSVYVKRLIFGNSAAIMYYIFVYCEFTLLIPLIDKLARSKYCYWGFVIAPAEIIVMRLMPVMLGMGLNGYVSVMVSLSCLGWFTYFYLGYMMGNKLLRIHASSTKLLMMWVLSIILQIAEGYWYLRMGEENCGTQVKLSTLLSGVLFSMLAYKFVCSPRECNVKVLKKLGDYSFGIYFSHIAIMKILQELPFYEDYVRYPINAIVTILLSTLFVFLGRKILGKNCKYFAL